MKRTEFVRSASAIGQAFPRGSAIYTIIEEVDLTIDPWSKRGRNLST